jgi:hypothetical protein
MKDLVLEDEALRRLTDTELDKTDVKVKKTLAEMGEGVPDSAYRIILLRRDDTPRPQIDQNRPEFSDYEIQYYLQDNDGRQITCRTRFPAGAELRSPRPEMSKWKMLDTLKEAGIPIIGVKVGEVQELWGRTVHF